MIDGGLWNWLGLGLRMIKRWLGSRLGLGSGLSVEGAVVMRREFPAVEEAGARHGDQQDSQKDLLHCNRILINNPTASTYNRTYVRKYYSIIKLIFKTQQLLSPIIEWFPRYYIVSFNLFLAFHSNQFRMKIYSINSFQCHS